MATEAQQKNRGWPSFPVVGTRIADGQVKSWSSMKRAADSIGVSPAAVRCALGSKSKVCKGWALRFGEVEA